MHDSGRHQGLPVQDAPPTPMDVSRPSSVNSMSEAELVDTSKRLTERSEHMIDEEMRLPTGSSSRRPQSKGARQPMRPRRTDLSPDAIIALCEASAGLMDSDSKDGVASHGSMGCTSQSLHTWGDVNHRDLAAYLMADDAASYGLESCRSQVMRRSTSLNEDTMVQAQFE
eukprot:TRINITY_DN17072_c0_g1_i3.p3 TRINITY_DN17072_c0_g1~~TRINITY_DN17072_c0_g1_i3.p3  ORF type:complete len:170 (-),score=22.27 TRINITY_DN17072_c0_g1_i3:184-693(-)